MTVDTLSLAKELRASELSPTQAEAIAAAIGRAVIEGAATKGDVVQLRTELKADLGQLEARIDAKFDQLRATMMTWFIGSALTVVALIFAGLKTLG